MNRLTALFLAAASLATVSCSSSPSEAEMLDRIMVAHGDAGWSVDDDKAEDYVRCVLTGMGDDAPAFTDVIVETDGNDDEFVSGLRDADVFDRFADVNPDCLRDNGAVGVDD